MSEFWLPIKLSIQIALVSGVIVLFSGVLISRLMVKKKFKGKILLETIILLPLVLPPSVIGFLLIVIFGRNSPLGAIIEWLFKQPIMFTWWAALIAATVVSFPLMYQSAKTGFQSIDEGLEDAARVDGANELKVFLLISIPLAFKSILSGWILSFARAMGEFGATLMFAGNIPGKTQTTSTAIYIAMDSGEMGLAWSWVGVIMVISFGMLVFINSFKSN